MLMPPLHLLTEEASVAVEGNQCSARMQTTCDLRHTEKNQVRTRTSLDAVGISQTCQYSEVVRLGVATPIHEVGLRRNLISAGPKIEIAAPYFDPGLICRKSRSSVRDNILWFTVWRVAMIIERLSREHRNIEKLLAILERELEVFDRGDRPDYEVIRVVISYFEVYPEVYHHPQEDLVFAKLRTRDPIAAAKVGDLAREHHKGAERLRRVTQAVESVLADRELLRENVDTIVRDFIAHERRHMMMEDRDFFPAALKALMPQDWMEIASAVTSHKDPLFSDVTEERFDALRAHILRLEQEAEAERK
jgi:hemerythrin-like domain-containing protein